MGATITFLSSQGPRKILRWQGRCPRAFQAGAPGQHLYRLRTPGSWVAEGRLDLGPALRRHLAKDTGAGAHVKRCKHQGEPANKPSEVSKTTKVSHSTNCQD